MKISQKKNSKWVIDFTCKGRRIRRVIGENKREAEAAATTIKADLIRDQYRFTKPKRTILFESFAKEYFELHSKQNKKSWERDKFSIKNLLSSFRGKSLVSITPDLVEKYKAKRKTAVSPATINRELACLKNMFTKAIEWGKVEVNPVKAVKLLKENNIKERILTNEEIEMLIKAASSHLKPILIIALNTGMRKSEILSLKWENINYAKGFIFIEDSKSGKSRKIPMNKTVHNTLRAIKKISGYIFYNPETKNSIKNVRKSFKTACKKANIYDLRLHDLRHTTATKMIEVGVDLVTVSKILGHSTIQMTMRYAHPTPENIKRAVDKLGEFFEKSRHYTQTPENSVRLKRLPTPPNLYN
ncbi:tyrosine-type recombinase/integrase [Acidobacteriota bacterium]